MDTEGYIEIIWNHWMQMNAIVPEAVLQLLLQYQAAARTGAT